MWDWLSQNWVGLLALVVWLAWTYPRSSQPWGRYVNHVEAHNEVFMRVAHPRRWPLSPRIVEYFYRQEAEESPPYWIAFPTGETFVDEGVVTDPGTLLSGMLEFARARVLQETMAAARELELEARREKARREQQAESEVENTLPTREPEPY